MLLKNDCMHNTRRSGARAETKKRTLSEDCEDGDETAARIADNANRMTRRPTPTRSKSSGGVTLQCSDNIHFVLAVITVLVRAISPTII